MLKCKKTLSLYSLTNGLLIKYFKKGVEFLSQFSLLQLLLSVTALHYRESCHGRLILQLCLEWLDPVKSAVRCWAIPYPSKHRGDGQRALCLCESARDRPARCPCRHVNLTRAVPCGVGGGPLCAFANSSNLASCLSE